MKIIFLDINGVVSTIRFFKQQYELNKDKEDFITPLDFDPICMSYLKEIVDESDAGIVISSSWRFGFEDEKDEYWQALMENMRKYDLDKKIIGITPIMQGKEAWNSTRSKEIIKWLEDNKDKNIEKFVIIDDRTTMDEALKNNFVRCHPYYGITRIVKIRALRILSD